MAFDFVMNFARDNDLQTVQACLLPTPPEASVPSQPSQPQPQALAPAVLQFQA
jgi:hypothetical protein